MLCDGVREMISCSVDWPQALAQQDKERAGRERGEAKTAAQPGKGPTKAAAADGAEPAVPKQPRAKTAYQVHPASAPSAVAACMLACIMHTFSLQQ